ncbi:MAG: S1C family serine protease [Saprospiraceae bacterium]
MKRRISIWTIIVGIILIAIGIGIGLLIADNSKTPENLNQNPRTVQVNQVLSQEATDDNGVLNQDELATIKLFENASPSVAFITTSNVRRDYWTMDVAEVPRGTGSAFIWNKEGHIITNYHVIQGADKATVTLSDRSTWEAELIGAAPEKDLAVLKINAPKDLLEPISKGNSMNLLVGQSVYAIGNPFGLDQTLTTGIISALGREIKSVAGVPIKDVIQTDAAINPGNSGGPLLNSSGELIGVNTAIYSPSGAYAGIGFSIPVNVVSWVVPDLIKFGKINRPTLGIELASQRIMQKLGQEGILVMQVIKNGAASKVGIQPTTRNKYGEIVLGDIITKIDDYDIKNRNDLLLTLEKYKPGDEVEITYLRNDEKQKVRLELGGN